MPQLIAMVIVVVGAMIYMFQTFGGTGDKIEGIAQKTSVITEINNIKTGLKLAAKSEQIATTSTVDGTGATVIAAANLKGLADLKYFAEQINDQISNNSASVTGNNSYVAANAYNAISFGGSSDTAGGMFISLVANRSGFVPGIYVDFNFTESTLKDSAGFFESQIANDLKDIAYIDRNAITATAATGTRTTTEDDSTIAARTPGITTASTNSESDGKFIIYFKDFGADETVVSN